MVSAEKSEGYQGEGAFLGHASAFEVPTSPEVDDLLPLPAGLLDEDLPLRQREFDYLLSNKQAKGCRNEYALDFVVLDVALSTDQSEGSEGGEESSERILETARPHPTGQGGSSASFAAPKPLFSGKDSFNSMQSPLFEDSRLDEGFARHASVFAL